MCIKCKHCKTSDLGVIAREVKTSPVRMTDGKIVAALADPSTETKYEVNYCFTCNKAITEKDLTDKEVCPVCSKEVEELVDGMCPDCKAKADEFANMSKEELIITFLKKEMEKKPASRRRTTTKKDEKAEDKVEDKVENTEVTTSQTVENNTVVENNTTVVENNVVVENKEIVQNNDTVVNKEPETSQQAELRDEEVNQAHIEMQEKVANADAPSTVKDVAQQVITDNVAATSQDINSNVPNPGAEDDLMTKLNALGNFNVGDAPF